MLKNYLKIAFRNLKRRKGYAFINVSGLAVGMAACLLIGLYMRHELSYDDFHANAERIYRVDEATERLPEAPAAGVFVQTETAPKLKAEIPEVQQATRISPLRSGIRHEGKTFTDVQGMYAEANFFEVFSFELLSGNPSALTRPNTVILTRPMAEKLFGDAGALGKTVSVEVRRRPTTLEVAGVVEEVPSSSHFTFDFLVSLETLRTAVGGPNFRAHELWTYVLLREGVEPAALEAVLQKVAGSIPAPPDYRLLLRPLPELYLHHWAPRQGDPRYLYLLGAVAAVILLIACANYTNLATARSTQRAREVGVRKVVGAHRSQLAGQFLGESVLLSLLALPLALILLYLALPFFNALIGTNITPSLRGNIDTLLLLVGLAVLAGLVAGGYPALFLSRFRPTDVLRNRLPSGWTGARLRKGLIVFQFMLSAVLLCCTAVILDQLRYVQQKNLGFDQTRLVALPLQGGALAGQARAFKQELLRLPHVQQAALSAGLPGTGGFGASASTFSWKERQVRLNHAFVDHDFIETLGLHLMAGRGFSSDRLSDMFGYVLNEAAVEALGWASPEAAVGERISFFGDTWNVIGVVEDFHFESLHQEIAPLSLQLGRGHHTVALRVEAGHTTAALADIRATWEQFTDMPFAYQFLDEQIDQLYRQEQRTAKILGGFAGVALLLACLGLFGLIAFAVERRTKEIGIRKVLGASVTSIVVLLSKDFLKLLGIAFVLAVPVAYVAMRRWLESFAYHTELGPATFLLIGVLVLTITALTVSYHSLKAALANPVGSLRDE